MCLHFSEVSECTADGKKCIFPFKWDKITYNGCTKAGSENGKAWCAHKVDSRGIVIAGEWGDCDPSCSKFGKNLLELMMSFCWVVCCCVVVCCL